MNGSINAVRETEKYGGGAVFAWGISGFKLTRNNLTIGCFSRNGVGPLVRIKGTMDAPQYRDILANHMLPYAQEIMPSNWFFLQDNDPKHTSNLLMGALRTLPDSRKVRLPGSFSLNCVRLLKHPAMSPDLNPIEHLWQIVKRKLGGKRFNSKDTLWEAVQEAWNSISIDTCISLSDSMPRRIHSIIASKGGPTKY